MLPVSEELLSSLGRMEIKGVRVCVLLQLLKILARVYQDEIGIGGILHLCASHSYFVTTVTLEKDAGWCELSSALSLFEA